MFFVTYSNLWSLSVFFPLTYIIFLFSVLFYCLPTLKNQLSFSITKTKSLFLKLNALDLLAIIITPLITTLILLLMWSAPSISVWFGHLTYTNYQSKVFYLLILVYFLVLITLASTSYFTSREIYDYFIVLYNFLYWILLLFLSNSIFTTIFVIEVISALIFLLIVTSTYSSNYYYRNLNLSFGNLFQNSTPHVFLQSLIFYFWISLISALNLFLFLLLLYIKCYTFDWFTLEQIFTYLTHISSFKNLISLGFMWSILILSIFIKSGIAPLYLYKPTFFKGLPFYTLFFNCTYSNFFYHTEKRLACIYN